MSRKILRPTRYNSNTRWALKVSVVAGLVLAGIIWAAYYQTNEKVGNILKSFSPDTPSSVSTLPDPSGKVRTPQKPLFSQDVQNTQQQLNKVAQCHLTTDGVFWPQTQKCIAEFQRKCMNITRLENLWRAGKNTLKELAYHASHGNTLTTCRTSSSQTAQKQTTPRRKPVSTQTVQTAHQTSNSSTPLTQTFQGNIHLTPRKPSDPLVLGLLQDHLKKLGCPVPDLPGHTTTTFWIPHRVALNALKKESGANISTDEVAATTFGIIEEMVLNHQSFPWCTKYLNESKRAYNALAGKT